jgi:SH3 domain protein
MTKWIARSIWMTFFLSAIAGAQTQYVSDELEVTLRTGPSTQNSIVRILKSGTALTVIEQDRDSGYAHVKTNAGTEGWVLIRFLMDQPVARDRLVVTERRLKEAREQSSAAREEAATLREELTGTQQRLGDAESAGVGMAAELNDIRSASANAVSLRDQNKTLRQRVSDSERQIDELKMENQELRSRDMREGMVIGAAVFLLGMLASVILPRLKPKRRSGWDL